MRAFRCLQPGGDCDSPGRSSGDAGAAVPQVSAAERRGGVVGGAHRVGVLGSLAGATCGPRSNFSSLIEKPPGAREGAQREFGGGHLGSCRPARPWVPRPALSKAACWLRSLMTRGKVVTSSSYGGGWNSTSRGARLLSGGRQRSGPTPWPRGSWSYFKNSGMPFLRAGGRVYATVPTHPPYLSWL